MSNGYTSIHRSSLVVHRLLLGCLLLDADCLPTPAAARARIGARALAAHRHTLAVAQAAVAADVHQPLDVELNLAARLNRRMYLHVKPPVRIHRTICFIHAERKSLSFSRLFARRADSR